MSTQVAPVAPSTCEGWTPAFARSWPIALGDGPHLRGIAPRADHKIIADSGKFAEIEDQDFKGLFAVRGPGATLRGIPMN